MQGHLKDARFKFQLAGSGAFLVFSLKYVTHYFTSLYHAVYAHLKLLTHFTNHQLSIFRL